MTAHLAEDLFDFALGNLTDEVRAKLGAHVANCQACAKDLAEATEALQSYAVATPPVTPPRTVRDRVLASVAAGGRLERFAAHISRIIDVSFDKAKALLDAIDDPSSWVPGPVPGVLLFHLEGGPAVAGAGVGFVRIQAGAQFPHHEHLGPETTFVVQGGFEEHDGTVQTAGTEDVDAAGTAHSFTALPGPDLIYLTVLRVGINIGGIEILVGDPRL